ncbi:MAG: hypothetical protein AAGD23_10290 [Pseudomonadota bacterium]
MKILQYCFALCGMASMLCLPAAANEILPFTGVYGDETGCSRYFGAPTIEGVAVDRAGVEGNEWFCTWHASSFQRQTRDDQWIEVFRVDAICFTEGDGRFVQGELMRNTDGSRLRLLLPGVYSDGAFPACRKP